MVSGFYESTCSGDIICDIFENENKIITEDSTVWFKTNKAIWEGKVIKIPFRDLPHYSNNLKLICINTKNEERILIRS